MAQVSFEPSRKELTGGYRADSFEAEVIGNHALTLSLITDAGLEGCEK
jgi:hypothetical protein